MEGDGEVQYGLLGCWLLVCWFAWLLGCWVAGLLGCWVAGLLVCWFVAQGKGSRLLGILGMAASMGVSFVGQVKSVKSARDPWHGHEYGCFVCGAQVKRSSLLGVLDMAMSMGVSFVAQVKGVKYAGGP